MNKWDLFLAGPWERYAKIPYKTRIKGEFKDKKIFDPEEREAQRGREWFEDNYIGMMGSDNFFAYVPDFPFPGVAQELGIYYDMHHDGNLWTPENDIIIYWDKDIEPMFGKEVATRMGVVTHNFDYAIDLLHGALNGYEVRRIEAPYPSLRVFKK